jgi:hypothetical protein
MWGKEGETQLTMRSALPFNKWLRSSKIQFSDSQVKTNCKQVSNFPESHNNFHLRRNTIRTCTAVTILCYCESVYSSGYFMTLL